MSYSPLRAGPWTSNLHPPSALVGCVTLDKPVRHPASFPTHVIHDVVEIGKPVELLILFNVLFAGRDGGKIVFAPEDFTAEVIVRRLDGFKTPPVL